MLDPQKHVFHSLRHTFASYTANMSDESRTLFVGHADLSIREGYTHVTEARIKELRETQRKMFTFAEATG
jgi:site-specific recombinase XerD